MEIENMVYSGEEGGLEDEISCSPCGHEEKREEDGLELENSKERNQIAETEEEKKLGDEILKLSILGLTFGGSWVLTIMGFIFSGIAKKKIRQYKLKYGKLKGRAKAGRTISLIGAAISWLIVICILLIIVLHVLLIVAFIKKI